MCSDLPSYREKLSSVILSLCTCRYKLLNQPHQLALAACGGFRHTLLPGSLIDHIEFENTNFLIKLFRSWKRHLEKRRLF